MAISLGFGIMFATIVILVLVPAIYLILEDFFVPLFLEIRGIDLLQNLVHQHLQIRKNKVQ